MRLAVLAVVLVGCGSSVETAPGGGAPPVETSPPSHEAGRRPTADIACSGPAAEACGYVRDIAAAAKRHYDETGVVCGDWSADSPAIIPNGGVAQMPSMLDGADFHTVDATQGWKCLGYSVEHPMQYQVGYHRRGGQGFPGAGVLGLDVADATFEASAKGDLDSDGIFSWFVIVGRVEHDGVHLSEMSARRPNE